MKGQTKGITVGMTVDAWVLFWRYRDGSGSRAVRVYLSEDRAKEDYELVEDAQDKEWLLSRVPCIK